LFRVSYAPAQSTQPVSPPLAAFQGATQQVTISELAARCFCSERHVRTLLRQAQEAGWLSWRAQSGRGKRGELTFHVAPESLRNAMMEEALKSGQQHNALELAQLA
jgi:MarR-like DNA-binding transcriptional regulator SgrR of sgrS sRNA